MYTEDQLQFLCKQTMDATSAAMTELKKENYKIHLPRVWLLKMWEMSVVC